MKTPAILFCPGDRPDRFQKALDRADSVILDLEDAVLPQDKDLAREAIVASNLPSERVIVRVNPTDCQAFQADIAAVVQTKYRTIMVSKAENSRAIGNIPSAFKVIALCETARGVREADAIAHLENVIGMMWGAEDLIASMGGTSSRHIDGEYREIAKYSRSRVLLAARAEDKVAIDAVYTDITDISGLRTEAEDAAASGFQAKACIHPAQVSVVREAFRPSEDELSWAQQVISAAKHEAGAFKFKGQMIDEPILRHARSLISKSQNHAELALQK